MERELMEQYPNKQPASTDDAPQRYVVFDQLDYRVRGAVMARNWDEARELGAKRLRVRPSVVWAVAVYEGETDEQAWTDAGNWFPTDKAIAEFGTRWVLREECAA